MRIIVRISYVKTFFIDDKVQDERKSAPDFVSHINFNHIYKEFFNYAQL